MHTRKQTCKHSCDHAHMHASMLMDRCMRVFHWFSLYFLTFSILTTHRHKRMRTHTSTHTHMQTHNANTNADANADACTNPNTDALTCSTIHFESESCNSGDRQIRVREIRHAKQKMDPLCVEIGNVWFSLFVMCSKKMNRKTQRRSRRKSMFFYTCLYVF